MRLVGNQVWFEGYHVANLCDNLVPTIQGEFEDAIEAIDRGTIEALETEVRELSEQNHEVKVERDYLVEEISDMKTAIHRVLK